MFSSVVAQAESVRQLKADKAPKEEVEKAVKQLLALKVLGNVLGMTIAHCMKPKHRRSQQLVKQKRFSIVTLEHSYYTDVYENE